MIPPHQHHHQYEHQHQHRHQHRHQQQHMNTTGYVISTPPNEINTTTVINNNDTEIKTVMFLYICTTISRNTTPTHTHIHTNKQHQQITTPTSISYVYEFTLSHCILYSDLCIFRCPPTRTTSHM